MQRIVINLCKNRCTNLNITNGYFTSQLKSSNTSSSEKINLKDVLQRLKEDIDLKDLKAAKQEKENLNNEKVIKATNQPKKNISKEKVTFAKLFKESKFVQLGDPVGKIYIGRIVEVNGDDLYIDYGGKFNCICKKPLTNADKYIRNQNVRIRLKAFEMSSYFLNSARDITLLESDAELLGIYYLEKKREKDERTDSLKKEIEELNTEPTYY